MMKIRVISIILAALLISSLLVGCADIQREEDFHIVCTVFPIYDWVKNIVGDAEGVRVSLLVAD